MLRSSSLKPVVSARALVIAIVFAAILQHRAYMMQQPTSPRSSRTSGRGLIDVTPRERLGAPPQPFSLFHFFLPSL